ATLIIDSQTAIHATQSMGTGPSHYIWDLWHGHMHTLLKQHLKAQAMIQWVPGHKDILGNDWADEEAKQTAQHSTVPE
ncbi:hypothetical protein B0H10DRAFT_1831813, partial [Mycena sp. CBHHK59/15]